MDLQEPERKEPAESVIPMINVVFLLLIFFLISATLAPPIDATPPTSDIDGAAADPAVLVINRDDQVAFGELRGDAAVTAAAQGFDSGGAASLALLADADASGAALARVMRNLSRLGVKKIALTTLRGSGEVSCGEGADPRC